MTALTHEIMGYYYAYFRVANVVVAINAQGTGDEFPPDLSFWDACALIAEKQCAKIKSA